MDTNTKLKITLFVILVVGIVVVGLSMNQRDKPVVALSKENYESKIKTIDSLTNVVDSLQMEIFSLEDGFDSKEHRYEDVLFEYELGISYLKDYHPKAYKDFHRIIGMKEDYTHELERENSKRLKQNNL
jgi:hypothetical protein